MAINWPTGEAPIARLEVRLLSLPTRATMSAAHDTEPATDRELTVVKLVDDSGNIGWGECSALNRNSYWPETARSSFELLRSWTSDTPVDDVVTPMATAALEMAATDLKLRVDGVSFGDHIGATSPRFTAGAVVGMGEPEEVLAQIDELVEAGFRRVKVKIQPGHDVDVVHAIRVSWPELEIQIDANGSYGPGGVPTMLRLKALGVRVFEQPFDWRQDDIASIHKLMAAGAIVVADEAVATTAAFLHYHHQQAVSAVAIKPSRLGGIVNTMTMIRLAKASGVGMTAGGMLESGLGRHLLAGFAARPEFTITGDVSPAGRWLAADPWPDLQLVDGDILTPTEPGIAPEPDPALLDHYTIDMADRSPSG